MSQKQTSLKDLLDANEFLFLEVSPDDLVRKVACAMPEHHTSAAAVLDENGMLVGIVTERDIVEKAVAERNNVDETTVDKIMTRDPITIQAQGTLIEALDIMTKNGIRTLPVMDGEKFVGIIDIRDLYEGMQNLLREQLKMNEAMLTYAFGESYGAGGGGYSKTG